MFIPKDYRQTDIEQIQQLIVDFPLATIVANTDKGLESSHIPLYFEQNMDENDSSIGYLYGHIAKANPLFKRKTDKQWLVIFQDMGHYISPNWYPDKAITHRAVPTWNYCGVHFTVEVEFIEDADVLKDYIRKLTDALETVEEIPWSMAEASEQYVNSLMRAIVGIKMKVVAMQAQFKLSQDKNTETKDNVSLKLNALDTDAARRMAMMINKQN